MAPLKLSPYVQTETPASGLVDITMPARIVLTPGEEKRHDLEPLARRLADVTPRRVEFAIEGLATAREPVFIVAEDGAGKSTVLISALAAMAAGERLFDHFHVLDGPVLLISEEDPDDVIKNRACAVARGHGWDADRVEDRFHVAALEGVQVDDPEWQERIIKEVRRIGAVAVGLDPYADLTSAKENDNDETRPFKAFLRRICAEGATPIVCHHAGKAFDGKKKKDRMRGATALRAAARSILYLEEAAGGISVEPTKLSRAKMHDPFVVTRDVETDSTNPGWWNSARLVYRTGDQVAKIREQGPRDFVLGLLRENGSLNSSALRARAHGSGFSGQSISDAISALKAGGLITFDPGPRNAKNWKLSLPDSDRQGGQPTLPTLP